jgi:hemerythrin-like metal-binding protein
VNELYDAMMKGQGKAHTGPVLHKLVRYTRDHFAFEEAAMTKAGYAELTAHHKHHVELTQKVEEFAGRFDCGETALSIAILKFLTDWLTGHIQGEDVRYAPTLKAHGIQ